MYSVLYPLLPLILSMLFLIIMGSVYSSVWQYTINLFTLAYLYTFSKSVADRKSEYITPVVIFVTQHLSNNCVVKNTMLKHYFAYRPENLVYLSQSPII